MSFLGGSVLSGLASLLSPGGSGTSAAGAPSSQQIALDQYMQAQGLMQTAWGFGGGNPQGQGMSESTNKVLAGSGPRIAAAEQSASQADQAAAQNLQLAQLAAQGNAFGQGFNNPPSGNTSSSGTFSNQGGNTFNSPSNTGTDTSGIVTT